jgi:hypothetical protein
MFNRTASSLEEFRAVPGPVFEEYCGGTTGNDWKKPAVVEDGCLVVLSSIIASIFGLQRGCKGRDEYRVFVMT